MSRSGPSGPSKKSRRRKVKPEAEKNRVSSSTALAALAGAALAGQQVDAASRPDADRAAQPEEKDRLLQDDRLPQEALALDSVTDSTPASAEQLAAVAGSEAKGEPQQTDAATGDTEPQAAAEADGNTQADAVADAADQAAAAEAGDESGPEAQSDESFQLAQASKEQDQKPAAAGAETKGGAAGQAEGTEGAAAGAEGGAAIAPIAIAGGLALAAAAGGGGGAVAAAVAPIVPVPVPGASGFLAKGLLSGANIGYDLNGNGILDAGEILTQSKADGSFAFPAGTVAPAGAKILASGGTFLNAAGNPVAFTGTLSAPAGVTAITPFSTLAAAGLSPAALSEMLGGRDINSLTAADFDSPADSLEILATAFFEQINAGTPISAIVAALNAGAASLNLSDPNAVMALASLAASGSVPDAGDLAKINAGLPFHASAVFNSATGAFDHYHIKESDLGLLGGTDHFGADELWVDVEGTILGTGAAPISFQTLANLGVDHVVVDDLAPYLRLVGSQVDNGNPGFTIGQDPLGTHNVQVVALDGEMGAFGGATELNTNVPFESNLGISMADTTTSADLAGFRSSADWSDPLNILDDHD